MLVLQPKGELFHVIQPRFLHLIPLFKEVRTSAMSVSVLLNVSSLLCVHLILNLVIFYSQEMLVGKEYGFMMAEYFIQTITWTDYSDQQKLLDLRISILELKSLRQLFVYWQVRKEIFLCYIICVLTAQSLTHSFHTILNSQRHEERRTYAANTNMGRKVYIFDESSV